VILAERLAGAPAPPWRKQSFSDVLDRAIGAPDECRPWQGVVGVQRGAPTYGKHDGGWAHRRAHELLVGPIPPGHDLRHTCGMKRCVNPAYHEVLPHGQRSRRTMPAT
jgi:hypothetical protein